MASAAPGPVRRVLTLLAWAVAGVLVLLVVLRVTGAGRGKVLALLLGALPLTLLPAYPLLLVAALLRRRLLVVLAAGLVLAHVAVIAPALGAEDVPAAALGAPRLRVVSANVLKTNPVPEEAGRALRALSPDVLVLAELRTTNLPGLRASGLLDDLPYSTLTDGPPDDVELFSRLPLGEVRDVVVVPGLPQPRGVVDVGGVPVRLAGAHPLPPLHDWEPGWRASLRGLAGEAVADGRPLVAAGDLNADRDLAPFRDLLAAGLRDAADERGHGLSGTWPQRLPVLGLDHVLVRDGTAARLVVLDQRDVALPGSDHEAVLADLAVLAREPRGILPTLPG